MDIFEGRKQKIDCKNSSSMWGFYSNMPCIMLAFDPSTGMKCEQGGLSKVTCAKSCCTTTLLLCPYYRLCLAFTACSTQYQNKISVVNAHSMLLIFPITKRLNSVLRK